MPLLLGLLVILAGGTIAYFMVSAEEQGGEPAAGCAVILDRSASMSGAIDTLTSSARDAFEECASKEGVLALYTLDASGTGFARGERFELYPEAFRTSTRLEASREERLTEARSAFETAVSQAPASGPGQGSNLLGAMSEAGRFLSEIAESDGVQETYLVVLSDGLQGSSGASVETLVDGSPEELLQDAADAGLIPDLAGVNVVFIGVGLGETADGEPLPDGFVNQLRAFWSELVQASGGAMCATPGVNAPPELLQECT